MDNLSSVFLKLHKKEKKVLYNPIIYNGKRQILRKWEDLKINISDLNNDKLKKWFLLFKDCVKKQNINNNLKIIKSSQNYANLIINSNSIIEYARAFNQYGFHSAFIKEIENFVIDFYSMHNKNITYLLEEKIKNSNKVFIGGDYDEKYDNNLKIIKETINKNFKLVPIRLDEKEHNNIIDNELYQEMNDCDFGIFDITANNSNVAFEAGYMLGKEKEIILICEKKEFDNVKFDFNHRNIILFRNFEELNIKLMERVKHVIEKIYINSKNFYLKNILM